MNEKPVHLNKIYPFMMLKLAEYHPDCQEKLDEFFGIAFPAAGFFYNPGTTHYKLKNIKSFFLENGGGFWILTCEEIIVGTIGLVILSQIQKIGELKCLYVHPEYIGKGCGKLLLDKALQEAELRNLEMIRLDVKRTSDKAIRFYKKNGFVEIPRYNENPNDVIFMQLKLNIS